MKKTIIITLILLFLFITVPSLLLLRYELTGKYHENTLKGVFIPQEFPSVSTHDFLDGTFQKDFSKWFQENVGLKELFIRINNQIYYSAFNKSYQYSGNIIIGKGLQLYEKSYIEDYTNELPTMSVNDQNELVSKIKKVQDLFAKRGIRFILMITPSKAYTYPEYIPDEFLKHKQGPTTYDSIVPLLTKSEINLVDGQRIVLYQKNRSVYPMFPRGGTHFTYLGAYFVTAELMKKVEKITKRNIPELRLTGVETKQTPDAIDKDLAELLNLVHDPLDYIAPLPELSVYKNKSASKGSHINVSMIGSSFTLIPYIILADQNIFSYLYNYLYYTRNLWMFPEHRVLQQSQFNPRTSEWWNNNILKSNVVILEINQSMFTEDHVKAFLDDAFRILP